METAGQGMESVRRVQKTGGGTLTLSLPKEWAQQYDVKAGSTAFVSTNSDGSLTVRATPSRRSETRVVDTGTDLENSLRKVVAAYVAGADAIRVKGALAAAVCEQARARLSALEIMEETADEVTLEVFEQGEGFGTDNLIRRMHVVCMALFKLAQQLFEEGSNAQEEVEKRESEVDRLYFFVLRRTNKERGPVHEALSKALAANALEDLADNLQLVCVEGRPIAPNPKVLALLREGEKAYANCFEALYLRKYSEKRFEVIEAFEKRVENLSAELMKAGKKGGNVVAMKGVLERMYSLAEHSKDLLELGSNLVEFERESAWEKTPLKQENER